MSKEKQVIFDIKTVQELENNLQATFTNHTVAVLDVYNQEWGPCKSVTDFLKRLFFDNNNLKLFTVDIDGVLANLKVPPEDRGYSRPKNVEHIRDTLSEHWVPLFEARRPYSKPYFLFYKEGKMVKEVHGVNAPAIKAYIKDLCAVKTPAADYITNPKLLEIWEGNFNADESEVSWEKWLRQLNVMLKITVPLDEAERRIMLEALKISLDAKEKLVTAENLQNWVGDDEKSLLQAFSELLPEYEDRAAKVRAQKEEEERVRAEQEAKEQAEADKKRQEEEAKAAEEKRIREEEEGRLRAEREAKEREEMSEGRMQQLESELETLNQNLEGCTEKIKEIDAAYETPAAVAVDASYLERVGGIADERAPGVSKERAATNPQVLRSAEDVAAVLALIVEAVKALPSEGTLTAVLGALLSLKVEQLAAFFAALKSSAGGRGVDAYAHYVYTGDAAQLSIMEDTTVPAWYPKLAQAFSVKDKEIIDSAGALIALLSSVKTSSVDSLSFALRGAAAEAMKALQADETICFPFMVATSSPEVATRGDLVVTISGLRQNSCAVLSGSAFKDETAEDYLLPPFLSCKVVEVSDAKIVLSVEGDLRAPGGLVAANAAAPVTEAVDAVAPRLEAAEEQLQVIADAQRDIAKKTAVEAHLAKIRAKMEEVRAEEEAKAAAEAEAKEAQAEEGATAAEDSPKEDAPKEGDVNDESKPDEVAEEAKPSDDAVPSNNDDAPKAEEAPIEAQEPPAEESTAEPPVAEEVPPAEEKAAEEPVEDKSTAEAPAEEAPKEESTPPPAAAAAAEGDAAAAEEKPSEEAPPAAEEEAPKEE